MDIQTIPVSSLRKSRSSLKGRQVTTQARADISTLLGDAPLTRTMLIEHLHKIQDAFGHISAAHVAALAEAMRLSQVEVYEVATFYHHFDVVRDGEAPPAKTTIRVCDSVACMMAGAEKLKNSLQSTFGADSAGSVRVISAPCVGACDHAPVAVVGQTQVKSATVEKVSAEISPSPRGEGGFFSQKVDVLDVDTPSPPHLRTSPPPRGEGDALPEFPMFQNCAEGTLRVENVIATLSDANLRGLGGAGFPAGKKWQIVRGFAGARVLVVNADEGEPGTFKDRHYLETNPWQFWEGVLIAAWAVEAHDVYVYLRDEYHDLRRAMTAQLELVNTYLRRRFPSALPNGERENPLTPNPLPMGEGETPVFPNIELRRGAGAYICGEESALIESIEGKRGLPRLRPPYIAERGVFGRPTLAHNVETLYWIPEILAKGAVWWASHGRNDRVGLRSFSVSGRVKNPGVKLAPAGISLNELIGEFCGGMADGHTLYGYLPGGASGGILPASLADVPLDFDTLQPHGAFIGSAAIVVFSQADKARDIALNLMQFFADESCGQCTPCRAGTEKAVTLMQRDTWDEKTLTELSQTMMDASICGLGQAAPNPVLTAMKYFPQEFAAQSAPKVQSSKHGEKSEK